MFVSWWKWKTRKIMIPSPVPYYKSLVSVIENIDNKRKKTKKNKKEKKKEKNADRKQTKLNPPHVTYNIKILSQ